jgi:hypothetical protein
VLTELQPAEHSSHFAAPSAGTAAVVGLADMAALGSESPTAAGADAMAAEESLSGGEADSASDAMDEADGPQPTAASRQQQSRWVLLPAAPLWHIATVNRGQMHLPASCTSSLYCSWLLQRSQGPSDRGAVCGGGAIQP